MRPEDLPKHNCLIYSLSSEPTDWRLAGPGGEQVEVSVSGTYRANNSLALREALLAGLGIARIPAFVIREDLRSGRLVPVLTGWRPREQSLFCLHPSTRRLPPKARVFIDFFKGHLRQAGFWS